MFTQRYIYLDHAATTPLRPAAKELLLAHLDDFGNPSSVHQAGQRARHLLDGARRDLAEIFGLRGEQVVFTSGGTEANNLALRGVMAAAGAGQRLLVCPSEHSCVINTAKALAEQGTPVTWLKVDTNGQLDMAHLETELSKGDVALVSIHTANNETGVLMDVAGIYALAKQHGALFHTDAVQSPLTHQGHIHADLVTISGHKFGGLKGAGALLIKGNPPMLAQITGGAQERNRRAGTEPLLPIITQTAALQDYVKNAAAEHAKYTEFNAKIAQWCADNPTSTLVASHSTRAAHVLQLITTGKTGADTVMTLDIQGIAASQGSACTSGRTEPSHVLQAMGYTSAEANNAIRISFGHTTTQDDIDAFLQIFQQVISA